MGLLRLALYLAYGFAISFGWRTGMKLRGPLAGEGKD